MATSAQITANQSNAQHSTGPKTPEGRAIAARNNFRHGFTGEFRVLPWEDQEECTALFTSLCAEHEPSTTTEKALVDTMAQSLWLRKRALILQDQTLNPNQPTCDDEKQLALFIRYQTTHDRAFHKSLEQLLRLRAEKRKQEIGFESQKRKRQANDHKRADQTRREAAENRKQELHHYSVLLGEAKLDHQLLLTSKMESANAPVTRQEEQPIAA
jgi:hypothetical protein